MRSIILTIITTISTFLISCGVQYYLDSADSRLKSGKFFEAAETYKELMEKGYVHDSVKYNYLYACSNVKSNLRMDFINFYINKYPEDSTAKVLIGNTFMENGYYIKALDVYMLLLPNTKTRDTIDYNFLYCVNKIKPIESIKYIENYLKYTPNNIDLQFKIAYGYLENKRYDSSFIYYNKLRKLKLTNKQKEVVETNILYLIKFLTANEVRFIPENINKKPEYNDKQYLSKAERLLDKLNYYRNLCGLEPVKLNKYLGLSAQNHAEYLSMNKEESSFQDMFKAGYSAKTPLERMNKYGYNKEDVDENIIIIDEIDYAVEFVLNSVYHRVSLLKKNLVEIGIGFSGKYIVLDCGLNPLDDYDISYCTIYPTQKQRDIPTIFKNAYPNPLPLDYKMAGSPITLQFTLGKRFLVDKYRLSDENKKEIGCWVLTPDTDKNKLLKQEIAIIPKEPLGIGKKYNFYIKGSVDEIVFEKQIEFFTAKL